MLHAELLFADFFIQFCIMLSFVVIALGAAFGAAAAVYMVYLVLHALTTCLTYGVALAVRAMQFLGRQTLRMARGMG